MDFVKERGRHFVLDMPLNVISLVFNLIRYVVIWFLELPGKFALTSPYLTYVFPIMFATGMVQIQFMSNFTVNRDFAGGNFFLIGMQVFTLAQLLGCFLLLSNTELYLYDLRPLRFVSFVLAVVFDLWYIAIIGADIEMVNSNERDWEHVDDTNKVVFDALFVTFLSYLGLEFFPTFLVNMLILMKELTMNQLAWTRDDDYREGYVLGHDTDILKFFRITEDLDYYEGLLKNWT